MKTIFIVTKVDHGDSCDGKACVLDVFDTREDAKNYVDEDIREWVDCNTDELRGCGCDFISMSAWLDYDDETRCEWNISEIAVG